MAKVYYYQTEDGVIPTLDALSKASTHARAEIMAIISLLEKRGGNVVGSRVLTSNYQHEYQTGNFFEFRGQFVRVLYTVQHRDGDDLVIILDILGPLAPLGTLTDAINKSTSLTDSKIIVASEDNWSKLINTLTKYPDILYSLTPRKFEELIAELLIRDGLTIELTPQSKDGGRDILVRSATSLGEQLIYVECKHYAKDRPVGVELVRGLYGVIEADRVTAGVLVTTSYFTKGAKSFSDLLKHRISLKDHKDLTKWLERYK